MEQISWQEDLIVVEAVNEWRISHDLKILIPNPRDEFKLIMSKLV